MSDEAVCVSCRKPKASHECQICHEAVCKKCTQFMAVDAFSFLPLVPENLKHTQYCGTCFDQEVAPTQEYYSEVMERARAVPVFFKTQRKHIPLISRTKDLLKVEECIDKDETIMRLAFLAAQQGFNGIIEVEVLPKKIRNAGYQTSSWYGTAFPAKIDMRRLDKDDLAELMYR